MCWCNIVFDEEIPEEGEPEEPMGEVFSNIMADLLE
jgi:hypothetical protein